MRTCFSTLKVRSQAGRPGFRCTGAFAVLANGSPGVCGAGGARPSQHVVRRLVALMPSSSAKRTRGLHGKRIAASPTSVLLRVFVEGGIDPTPASVTPSKDSPSRGWSTTTTSSTRSATTSSTASASSATLTRPLRLSPPRPRSSCASGSTEASRPSRRRAAPGPGRPRRRRDGQPRRHHRPLPRQRALQPPGTPRVVTVY